MMIVNMEFNRIEHDMAECPSCQELMFHVRSFYFYARTWPRESLEAGEMHCRVVPYQACIGVRESLDMARRFVERSPRSLTTVMMVALRLARLDKGSRRLFLEVLGHEV